MTKYLGKKGLIFNGLANEYYEANKVTNGDISTFYELCTDKNLNWNDQNKKNYIAASLFFKSRLNNKESKASKDAFLDIERKIKPSDEMKETNLTLAYNIIEFEDKFEIANKQKFQEILQYLLKFADLEKNLEYFILFKYYSAILYLREGRFQQSAAEYFEIIAAIDEHAQKKKDLPFFKYLNKKNDLLYLRITKASKASDKHEYLTVAKNTFAEMKKKDVDLALKIGIDIYNVLEEDHNLQKCEDFLSELSGFISSSSYENQLKNGLNFYILIAIRMAYIYCMKNDFKNYIRALKKLTKSVRLLDTSDKKNANLKLILEFIILIYRLNINSNNFLNTQIKGIVNDIKNKVILGNAFEYQLFKVVNEVYVNIYAIYSEDESASSMVNSNIRELSNNLDKVQKDPTKTLSYIFGLYNLMSNYSFSYIQDTSEVKRKEYADEMKNLYTSLSKFIENSLDKNKILLYPFVQSIIYKAFYAAGNLFLNEGKGNLGAVQDIIAKAESIHSYYHDTCRSQIETFGFIKKLRGDLLFYTKDYKSAMAEYKQAEILLGESNDQERAFVLTNLGIVSFLLKDGKNGHIYLSKALSIFSKLTREKGNCFGKWEVLRILYANKIKTIQTILGKFNY